MCGIGVTVDMSRRDLARPWALPLMRHRGPDDQGVFRDPEADIALEHCRLAIIDPENPESAQPFTDPSGRWVIVYNGELFNYRELRGELEREGVRFRTQSDTEVVLNAFIAGGMHACARFRGMFAFVVWDHESRELVAVRDQIGVKPLYWSLEAGVFVAASELRTMLGHPAISVRLDLAGVIEYLAFGYTSHDRTLVAGVAQASARTRACPRRWTSGARRYWDVLPATGRGAEGAVEPELLGQLDEAVAASLVSDVPLSLMLSGGLDSAAVAALAARHVDPSALTAYSVSFGLPTDESSAAARLAKDLGMPHRELLLTEGELKGAFDAWLTSMDVPSANPTWIAISHIARAVHADGTKVLLSGDGGDELFGGYQRWMTYLRFHEQVWKRSPSVFRRAGGRIATPVLRGLAGDIARRARDGGELFVGSRPFHDDDLRRTWVPSARRRRQRSPRAWHRCAS